MKELSLSIDDFGTAFFFVSGFRGGSKKLIEEVDMKLYCLGTPEFCLLFLVVLIFLVGKPF
jgi:hypothetical protein